MVAVTWIGLSRIATAPGYARPEKYVFADPDTLKKETADFFKVWDKYFRK